MGTDGFLGIWCTVSFLIDLPYQLGRGGVDRESDRGIECHKSWV